MDHAGHWRRVWRDRTPESVSWYQPVASVSLELIQALVPQRDAAVIDVGGGASTLVDGLLDAGYTDLTVLDITDEALAFSRARLAARARLVNWTVCDVLDFAPESPRDLWHDRAVFHFLDSADDRRRYVDVLERTLRPGGKCIIATFAPEGPERCSGLPVRRYDARRLAAELGGGFRLLDERREVHTTPGSAAVSQAFAWCTLERR